MSIIAEVHCADKDLSAVLVAHGSSPKAPTEYVLHTACLTRTSAGGPHMKSSKLYRDQTTLYSRQMPCRRAWQCARCHCAGDTVFWSRPRAIPPVLAPQAACALQCRALHRTRVRCQHGGGTPYQPQPGQTTSTAAALPPRLR